MKKNAFLFLAVLVLAACQPSSEGTTSQAQVTVTSSPQVEPPMPLVDGALTTAEAQEWTSEDLQTRLAAFQTMPLYQFISDSGKPILLENIDKPTGKAAFDIRQDSFTLAFGVNGERWLTLEDGDRNVVMNFDNYTNPATGQKSENMFAYLIYLDPDTHQITDKIDENSLPVPVLTQIIGMDGQPSKLIYLDWHNPLLSEADFYDVVVGGKPADALLSIVSPKILEDIVSAPDFVQEINFEDDWKVVFDQEGNSVMIDVVSEEELGQFENGRWNEQENPLTALVQADFEKYELQFDAEKYDVERKMIGGEQKIVVTDIDTGMLVYESNLDGTEGGFHYEFSIPEAEEQVGGQKFEPKWTDDGKLYGVNGATAEVNNSTWELVEAFKRAYKNETGQDFELTKIENGRNMEIYLGNNQWGRVLGYKEGGRIVMELLIFEDRETGEVVGLPLIPVGQDELFRYVKARRPRQ